MNIPRENQTDLWRRYSSGSSIMQLMDDLGEGMTKGSEICMLGGGNPAHVPEMEEVWSRQMQDLLDSEGSLSKVLGEYDAPKGSPAFIDSFLSFMHAQLGWDLKPEQVAITQGGQTACFYLFNLLAGPSGGRFRTVQLPLLPEYIGYSDQGLHPDMFKANKPLLVEGTPGEFRYEVDFDALDLTDDTSLISLSRPTNPSGNVVDDAALAKLQQMAAEHGIPLMIDNAYGFPFPGVVFTEASPLHADNTINIFSLSKLGLPGTRTGIVVAPPEVIRSLCAMNAVVSLANHNIGQALVGPLLRSGELAGLCRDHVVPFYRERAETARRWLKEKMPASVDFSLHEQHGAFFVWIWFRNLNCPSLDLYQRCKEAGLIILPGEYFFYGIKEDAWAHRHQCIRLSFAQPDAVLERGVEILARVCEDCVR